MYKLYKHIYERVNITAIWIKFYLSIASDLASSNNSCNIIYLDGPSLFNETGPVFGSAWFKPVNDSRPEAQVSALELFTAAIHPNISCHGAGCNFDPPTPPPKPITCEVNPCPVGTECCKYPDGTWYTCCASNQKCNEGVCV